MAQSFFQSREFWDSVKKLTLESDGRTRDVLEQARDCTEIVRRCQKALSDSRQCIREHPGPNQKHGPHENLSRAQVLELYDKATSTFLRTRDAESRREVIELHHLLQRLK